MHFPGVLELLIHSAVPVRNLRAHPGRRFPRSGQPLRPFPSQGVTAGSARRPRHLLCMPGCPWHGWAGVSVPAVPCLLPEWRWQMWALCGHCHEDTGNNPLPPEKQAGSNPLGPGIELRTGRDRNTNIKTNINIDINVFLNKNKN